MVKRLPAMQETWFLSLGGEDLLEKEMATHSGILAWRIPWTEEHGRLQSMGSQKVRHDFTSLHLMPSPSRTFSVYYTSFFLQKKKNGKSNYDFYWSFLND